MKVLHLITTIDMGGAEKQLLVLVREQISSGIDVTVVPLKGSNELLAEFSNAGAKVLSELCSQSIPVQLFRLRNITRLHEYVLHAHLPRAELLASLIRHKKCLIVSRHNTENFIPQGPRILSITLSRWVYARAKGVICISQAVKNFMLLNLEIPDTPKVSVVHYGFDQNFQISRHKIKEKPHSLVGTIGRLVPQKDQQTIIRAVSYLAQKGIVVQLQILGEGPLREDLEKLVVDLGLEKQVKFMGRTSDVRSFLDSLDIFILASKYEGFGLVLLEAMCAGVPIIAAENSAIREVLGPEHKLYFETSNYLALAEQIEFLNSPKISKDIVDHQLINYQSFNPRKMSTLICQIYN